MKWRDANDYPDKSRMYITEVLIQESETYRPVAYNSFDKILRHWYNSRACATDGIVTKWLDESPSGSEAWVSVEDRLPDYGIGVLLIISTGMMTVGYLKEKTKTSCYRQWQLYGDLNSHMVVDPLVDQVTHWQPLPQPPIK